ncbi:MAG: hypothetical protein HN826_13620 [Methylococcales bacterium]|jgi:hypothetical protein|nr:hypothetical protein [Methylococcales bacterium]
MSDIEQLQKFEALCLEYLPNMIYLLATHEQSTENKLSEFVMMAEEIKVSTVDVDLVLLEEVFAELIDKVNENGSLKQDDEVVRLISNIGDMLMIAESTMGIYVASEGIKDYTAQAGKQPVLTATIDDLSKLYHLLRKDFNDNDIVEMKLIANEINIRYEIVIPHKPLKTIYAIEDVLSRVANNEINLHSDLIDQATKLIWLTRKMLDGHLTDVVTITEDQLDEEVEIFSQIVSAELCREAGAEDSECDIINLNVDEEFKKVLTAVNMKDIHDDLLKGHYIYEVLVNMDIDMEVTQKVVMFLQTEAKSITSATVFVDDKTLFNFLVTSEFDEPTLLEKMNVITTDSKIVSIVYKENKLSMDVEEAVVDERVSEVKTQLLEQLFELSLGQIESFDDELDDAEKLSGALNIIEQQDQMIKEMQIVVQQMISGEV